MPSEGGYLEAEGIEKTWRIKQETIAREVDLLSSRNQYDIVLPGLSLLSNNFSMWTFVLSVILPAIYVIKALQFLLLYVPAFNNNPNAITSSFLFPCTKCLPTFVCADT